VLKISNFSIVTALKSKHHQEYLRVQNIISATKLTKITKSDSHTGKHRVF